MFAPEIRRRNRNEISLICSVRIKSTTPITGYKRTNSSHKKRKVSDSPSENSQLLLRLTIYTKKIYIYSREANARNNKNNNNSQKNSSSSSEKVLPKWNRRIQFLSSNWYIIAHRFVWTITYSTFRFIFFFPSCTSVRTEPDWVLSETVKLQSIVGCKLN